MAFRATCYYYRKAYYRSFWLSPPACAVAEPHGSYSGGVYTPNGNFNGADSFTYKVTDRGDPDNCGAPSTSCAAAKSSTTETVSITVNPVNDSPVPVDDNYSMLKNTTLIVPAPDPPVPLFPLPLPPVPAPLAF